MSSPTISVARYSKSFVEKTANPDQPPQMDQWKMINAQFVVTGRSGRGGDGRLQTEFRLWDTSTGQQVAGQQYVTDSNNSRRVAHIISDAIFTRVTGEKGFFDTRIVYVDESGPKDKRAQAPRHHGSGRRQHAASDARRRSGVTPRFSPSSQDVTYMSFGRGDPKVYLMNIENGQREAVGNFPGMTFSPRFSPDGQKIIMSLSQGSNVQHLFTMDLNRAQTTRLTDTAAIDTSPSYSPDGGQIAFESDRGGAQQIYVMSASGGGAKRISFGEGAIRRRSGRPRATTSPSPSRSRAASPSAS
jgi:TolB protein